jgi:hypothetical protein
MGKNKNKAAQSAAQQAAAQQAAPEVKENNNSTKVNVIQLGDLEKMVGTRTIGSLDANHTADVLTGMRSMFFENKNAAKDFKMPEESVKEFNRITAIGYVALFTTSVVMDQTPFAVAMRQKQLDAILLAASDLGVNINTKLLPAPDENGNVSLPSAAIEPSEETIEAVREEAAAANKKVITDPTKIENETQLKESLLNILVKGSENFYEKVSKAINFYESYLSIQASKEEDKEEKLAALKEKSRVEHLTEIAHMLGKCPFSIGGMAKFMYENTERTKNPVVAFCMFRNASLNKKTGMPQIDDNLVADIVKVLIRWYADSEITTSNEILAGYEKNLEVLNKDKTKNAKAIEQGTQKIASVKKHIEAVKAVIDYTNIPDRSVIDSFPEDYVDDKREGYKMARMIGAKIIDSYYPGIKPKEIKQENLVHNLHQYIGVICNLFLPAMQQMTDFSEANITELEKVEATEEAGGAEKNE